MSKKQTDMRRLQEDKTLYTLKESLWEASKSLNRDWRELKHIQGDKNAFARRARQKVVEQTQHYLNRNGIQAPLINSVEKPPPSLPSLCLVMTPLCGFENFIRGVPFFSLSLSLIQEKELTHSVVFSPLLNLMFCGLKGTGTTLNEDAIFGPSTSVLEESLLIHSHPLPEKPFSFRLLGDRVLELCFVASGSVDGFYDNVFPLEVMSALHIVSLSGADVTTVDSKEGSVKPLALLSEIWSQSRVKIFCCGGRMFYALKEALVS